VREPFYRPYDDDPLPEQAKKWGNVARRGAREVAARQQDGEQKTARFSDDQERRRTAPPPRPHQWVRTDGSGDEWEDTPRPAGKGRAANRSVDSVETIPAGMAVSTASGRKALPPEIAAEIRKAADVATVAHRERLVERAESAYGAYDRGRYQDALRAIKPVVEETPSVAAVRELTGLAAYRTGKWRDAVRHLTAFATLTDSNEHLPVLMDCQRALRKPKRVADLWNELRQSSPEPDVLAEGRIVAAASLAESGDLQSAITMLSASGASKALRNPSNRHVRQWYLLADLYERAGDVPKARELFERVIRVDREAYDVADRLANLGPVRKPRSKPKPQSKADKEKVALAEIKATKAAATTAKPATKAKPPSDD
jgi:tetratricopeptide (TPR) repeat protein